MDWTHTITIISTTLAGVAGVFLVNRKDIQIMDKNHREDIQKMDAKIDKMDEKWERLFSLFVEQIKQQKEK